MGWKRKPKRPSDRQLKLPFGAIEGARKAAETRRKKLQKELDLVFQEVLLAYENDPVSAAATLKEVNARKTALYSKRNLKGYKLLEAERKALAEILRRHNYTG